MCPPSPIDNCSPCGLFAGYETIGDKQFLVCILYSQHLCNSPADHPAVEAGQVDGVFGDLFLDDAEIIVHRLEEIFAVGFVENIFKVSQRDSVGGNRNFHQIRSVFVV